MKKLKCFLTVLLLTGLFAGPMDAADSELTQELADRYETMLIRSPQPGSSFDRVIEWYSTKGGGLEVLQKRWKEAASTRSDSGPAYLVLQGLLAERLRSPENARRLYREAMAGDGDASQAARLLAALETTEGNFPAAAEAYQKALASESLPPVDRLDLMRALALLYQRSFQDAKALAVWKDALQRYPNDPYVLEEAGEAFLGSSDYTSAKGAFSKLREVSAKDAFRKVSATLRLGRTAELEGKSEEAISTYEQALAETSEGSWINREVRSRIEELFRRKDDLPGLVGYYDKRTAAFPQDYQSFAAKGVVLQELARSDEALAALRKATELAPENGDLRMLYIRSLAREGRNEDAIVEARELAKSETAPVEAILTLGNLQWNRFEKTKKPEDRAEALATWRRIAPGDSTDISRIAQLAELFASRNLTSEAVAEWLRIVKLSPSAADARLRLAQVYLTEKKPDEAVAVLTGLVEGDGATPENYLTLIRGLERLKLADTARGQSKKARELFPKDYELLNLAWNQAQDVQDKKAVEELFPIVWESAPNEFFRDEIVRRYVSFLESGGGSEGVSGQVQNNFGKRFADRP